MQPTEASDLTSQIWEYLKIIGGAIVSTATTLWALFAWQNKKETLLNQKILNEIKTEVYANSERDKVVKELLIKEIALNESFRDQQEKKWQEQEKKWDKQEKINQEFYKLIHGSK